MRTLIFILTLLISFQPASWAAGNCLASETGDKQPAVSSLDINTPGSGHQGCLIMTDTKTDTTAPDCLVNCLAGCTSAACLELSVSSYHGNRLLTAYQPSLSYNYVWLNESPEIHPPRAHS